MLWDLSSYGDLAWLALRAAIGIIFIYHALPKLKAPEMMAKGMGMSSGMVSLLGLVELLAGLGVLLGVYIQLAALALALVMVGAWYFKQFKWHIPFSAHDKMGWEFDLLLLAAAVLIAVQGGGSLTLM